MVGIPWGWSVVSFNSFQYPPLRHVGIRRDVRRRYLTKLRLRKSLKTEIVELLILWCTILCSVARGAKDYQESRGRGRNLKESLIKNLEITAVIRNLNISAEKNSPPKLGAIKKNVHALTRSIFESVNCLKCFLKKMVYRGEKGHYLKTKYNCIVEVIINIKISLTNTCKRLRT